MPINSGVGTSLSAIIQLWAIPTLLTVSLGTNALLGFTALIGGKEAVSDSPLEIDGVCKAMAMTSSMRSTGTKRSSLITSRGTSSRSFILRLGKMKDLDDVPREVISELR